MRLHMKLILKFKRIIKECYERARKILTENRDKLDLIAKTLLEVETLDAEQIKYLVDHGHMPDSLSLEAVKIWTKESR